MPRLLSIVNSSSVYLTGSAAIYDKLSIRLNAYGLHLIASVTYIKLYQAACGVKAAIGVEPRDCSSGKTLDAECEENLSIRL